MKDVAETAVIGVPDEILGQAIVAYIRSLDGHELIDKQIQKHCRLHLEDFMVPQAVHFVDSFPLTSSGKIDKLALKAMYEAAREDTIAHAMHSIRNSIVGSGISLVVSIFLFFIHWTWMRRLSRRPQTE